MAAAEIEAARARWAPEWGVSPEGIRSEPEPEPKPEPNTNPNPNPNPNPNQDARAV